MKKLIIIYVLAGIITFGHAWKTAEAKLSDTAFKGDPVAQSMSAVVASIGWPLYVSAQAWKD